MGIRLSCEVEVLTPLVLGGHEARKLDKYTPLRPHSIRGLLRWWFRAAAASLIWPTADSEAARAKAIVALRSAESKIFGSTEKSSLLAVLPPIVDRDRCRFLETPDPKRMPGTRYLGYGLFEDLRPEAILPSTKPLRMQFSLRHAVDGVPELLGATLWSWTQLGGLGARSRRGFGSLRLVSADPAYRIPDELLAVTAHPSALAKQLRQGIDWAMGVFREHLRTEPTTALEQGAGPHRELRSLYGIHKTEGIEVLPEEHRSAEEALERVGQLFRNFRSTLQRSAYGMQPLQDYFDAKTSIIARRAPASLPRAAFGLPLPFYFRSLQGKKATFLPVERDRLASPLLVRIHPLQTERGRRYVATLINLASHAAHPLLGLRLQEARLKQPFAPPDGRIVRELIIWARTEAHKSLRRQQGGRP